MASSPSSAPHSSTWTWRLPKCLGTAKSSQWGRCIRCVQTHSKVSSYWFFNWTFPYLFIFNAPHFRLPMYRNDWMYLAIVCNLTWPGECDDPDVSHDDPRDRDWCLMSAPSPSCNSGRWWRARCQVWRDLTQWQHHHHALYLTSALTRSASALVLCEQLLPSPLFIFVGNEIQARIK